MNHKSMNSLHYIVLSIIAVLFIAPIIWLVVASLDLHASLSLKTPVFTSLNYRYILHDYTSMQSFGNSLVLSVGQSFISIAVGILAAYPLSRSNMKYKRQVLISILFMTGLPIIAIMVPVYQLFSVLKMQNSVFFTVLFMSTASLPINIWLLRNFMNAVPLSLEESARIDGAGSLQVILKIIIPLMAPGIATAFIFTFSTAWGNFFVPYILLNSPNKLPASVRIYQFFGQYGLVTYGKLAAFSVIYTVPSVAMYIYCQRYLSRGLMLSGSAK